MDESALIAAARAGRLVDCGDDAGPGVVDSDVVRRICRTESAAIDPRGLRLQNAVLTGTLDLSGMRVSFPLSFNNCQFDMPLSLAGAELHALTITRSTLPGLLANGVRIRRDLDLSGSRIRGAHRSNASVTRSAAIWLCESDISGRLLCVDTVIDAGDQRAIQADRMHVRGSVQLIDNFDARGEIRLLGAHIDGSFALIGAHLAQPAGLALDIADTVIGGSIHFIPNRSGRTPVVRGRVDVGGAHIGGNLILRDAELTRADGGTGDLYWRRRQEYSAFSAPRLHVGDEIAFEGACVVTGGIDLSSGDLGSVTFMRDCRLVAPERTALDLAGAELRAGLTLEPGVMVEGSLALAQAHVSGDLTMNDTIWRAPADRSTIAAQGVRIDGGVNLKRIDIEGGTLRFRSAAMGRALDLSGARLHNPAGATLMLYQATVRGTVRLTDEFNSTGRVVLDRATIDGRLEVRGGRFTCPGPTEYNPRGDAIQSSGTTIRSGMYLGWASVSPSVDFTGTTTTMLADDPDNWPTHIAISGFSYERFTEPTATTRSAWDWRRRCAWLERQPVFDTSAYEQLARVFRQHGYVAEAEHVLIAQRTRAALVPSPRPAGAFRGVVRWLLHVVGRSFGYGYRPWRALWMLACLLVLVVVTVVVPPLRDTLRASDEQGDVYAPNGIVVVTTGQRAGGTTFADRATVPAGRDACGDGQVRCFDSVFFAVDTVVPLVSLDQRATWYADLRAPWGRFMDVWLNIATIVGWLLSSVFVLSFTRFVRNG